MILALILIVVLGVALLLPRLMAWAFPRPDGKKHDYETLLFTGLGLTVAGTLALLAVAVIAEGRMGLLSRLPGGAFRVALPLAGLALAMLGVLRALFARKARPTWRSAVVALTATALAWVLVGIFLLATSKVRISTLDEYAASDLRTIGIALFMYHDEQGVHPDDLWQLVDAELIGEKTLVCQATLPESDDGFEEACIRRRTGFHYIRLPPSAPADLVWVWAVCRTGGGPVPLALYRDGRVRRGHGDDLLRDLDRTYRWLEAQP